MKHHLSEKEILVVCFIQDFWQKYCYAPTIQECQDECGLSSKSVAKDVLDRLMRKELIFRESYAARTARLTEGGAVLVNRIHQQAEVVPAGKRNDRPYEHYSGDALVTIEQRAIAFRGTAGKRWLQAVQREMQLRKEGS